METNKISTTNYPLLKRTDSTYTAAYEGVTPKRLDLVKAISKKETGTVIVRHIYPKQGGQSAIVLVSTYADEKIAKAVENERTLAKQQPKIEAVAEAS